MIYPIVIYGHQTLRSETQDIDKNYPELDKLIEDMFQTMYNAEGIGLAAPQIGLSIRLFVVDLTAMADDDKDSEFMGYKKVFINPRIIEFGDELDTYNEENNPIVGFFKELDEDDINNQPTKDVYARYKLYCNENNFTPISHIQFTKYIKKELGMDVRVIRVKNKTAKVFRSDTDE